MTAATLPRLILPRVRPLALAIALSCLLAAVLPYDALFARVTLGQPVLRAGAMLGCWLGGLWLMRANGFTLGITGLRRPRRTVFLWAAAAALWCLFLDAVLFRDALPPLYAGSEAAPLAWRLLYYTSRAFNENVLYRLFLGSLFAWGLRAVVRRPAWSLPLAMLGMGLAHLLNVLVNVGDWAVSPAVVAWMLLRFIPPGLAWAWLYVRHGFAANEGAAVGVHLILQPLVSIAWH